MTKCGKPETLQELEQCITSLRWVLWNLMSIKPKKGGVVKFIPNTVQGKIFESYWWSNNILKSRQHGVSTFWMLLYTVLILINRDKSAGVIDITENDAKKKLGMAKTAYDNLDNPEVHSETWEMVNENGERATVAMWQIGAKLKAAVMMTKGREAPFPQEIVFSNGSSFHAGVSFRGGVLQYGLFTEFGKIAIKDPAKAAEIIEGAENAMHEGSIAVFETTMEGGQSGLAYERCQVAMKNSRDRDKLTRLDPLFMFFGWFEDSANQLDNDQTRMAMARYNALDEVETRNGAWAWKTYFYGEHGQGGGVVDRLADELGVDLSYNQIAWYVGKRISQGWAMLKEHPTFAEEAFQAPIKGAIYAEGILRAEAEERVSEFQPHKGKLVHTTWDIGSNRNTVVWYWQRVGPEWWCIDCDHDLDPAMTWGERKGYMDRKGYNFGTHALPHDAAQSKIGKITTLAVLEEAGFENVRVIPVTVDRTDRIDGMWGILPNIRFRKSTTEKGRQMLKLYRYKEDKGGGWITDMIVKSEANHYADAWGYLWEGNEASFFPDSKTSGTGKVVRRGKVEAGRL